MNINKLAKHDAAQWLTAEMFYGKGSNTRRMLLERELMEKYSKIPGYYEAFSEAYDKLDQNKYAKAAVKERKKIDRAAKTSRNVRGLLTGNKQSMTTTLLIVSTVAYVAHDTGYDKVALEYTKKKYAEAKKAVRKARLEYKIKHGTKFTG